MNLKLPLQLCIKYIIKSIFKSASTKITNYCITSGNKSIKLQIKINKQ